MYALPRRDEDGGSDEFCWSQVGDSSFLTNNSGDIKFNLSDGSWSPKNNMQVNRWYHFEFLIKAPSSSSATNGYARFYVDGTNIAECNLDPSDNLDWCAKSPNIDEISDDGRISSFVGAPAERKRYTALPPSPISGQAMAGENVKVARNEHPQGLTLMFLADSATRLCRGKGRKEYKFTEQMLLYR